MQLLDTMQIDESALETLLDEYPLPGLLSNENAIHEVLARAEKARGLSLADAALLLKTEEPALLSAIYKCADRVKRKIFGSRVVLFAPLYLSNHCNNGCLYCGFRASNSSLQRKSLSPEEVVTEAQTLESMGFKRLLMVTGEDPNSWFDNVIRSVDAVYRETSIRIIHLNAPTVEVEAFKELKKAGVGVYQAFQETYHKETYAHMHPTGRSATTHTGYAPWTAQWRPVSETSESGLSSAFTTSGTRSSPP